MSLLIGVLVFNIYSRIVINEVMSNPRGITGSGYPEDRNEYVELYNLSSETVDVRGWRLTDFDAVDSIIAWQDSSILNYYPWVTIGTTRIPSYRYALILDQEYLSSSQGGYFTPYNFPESLIILTVGNTTIGNELQTNDPILLFSYEGDSSSFGTPFFVDSFPYDLGDGTSWERVSIELDDLPSNWHGSLDSFGTPGRPNSVYLFRDLGIVSMESPRVAPLNSEVTILVTVKNFSYQSAYYWQILLFNDRNYNGQEDPREQIFNAYGASLQANQETTFSFLWVATQLGVNHLLAKINYPEDAVPENNASRIIVNIVPTKEKVIVSNKTFSPDNDLIDDTLYLYYNFDHPHGKLVCNVYDLNGRLVRYLINNQLTASSGRIFWDGKGSNGLVLPIGLYIIDVQYRTSQERYQKKIPISLIKKS
jgi:hypothetical protein